MTGKLNWSRFYLGLIRCARISLADLVRWKENRTRSYGTVRAVVGDRYPYRDSQNARCRPGPPGLASLCKKSSPAPSTLPVKLQSHLHLMRTIRLARDHSKRGAIDIVTRTDRKSVV